MRNDAPEGLRACVVNLAYRVGLKPKQLRRIVCDVLNVMPDRGNWSDPNVEDEVLFHFGDCEWYRVYDLIEEIHGRLDSRGVIPGGDPPAAARFSAELNKYFRENGIGWQLSNGIVAIRGAESSEEATRSALDAPEVTGRERAEPMDGRTPASRQRHSAKRENSHKTNPRKWDVFLSYASEDCDAVVQLLATTLKRLGLKVWYDKMELRVGDRLRKKIDEGLAKCRYGVVILSTNFFSKHYPELELAGLAQREHDGENVILPVWTNVDAQEVRSYSPPLADRVAVKWKDGIDAVVLELLRVIDPSLHKQTQEAVEQTAKDELGKITSGGQLASIIGNVYGMLFVNDDLVDEEVEVIGGLHQDLRDLCDTWDDLSPLSQARASQELGESLKDIRDLGWSVYGRLEHRKVKMGHKTKSVPFGVFAATRGVPMAVFSLPRQNDVLILRGENPPKA